MLNIMDYNSFRYFALYNPLKSLGISKKVEGTVKAARELGLEAKVKANKNSILGMLRFLCDICFSKSHVLYIRFSDFAFPILFPILIFKRVMGHKIIVDVPTPRFVGVREIRGSSSMWYLKRVRILYNYISGPWVLWPAHRIVQYAGEGWWFSLGLQKKTIQVGNGIYLSSKIPIRKDTKIPRVLRLLAVAQVAPWHGFDRVIRTIAFLKNTQRDLSVYFTVVGDGQALAELKNLTKRLGLQKEVVFRGMLDGEELNQIFDENDIGISSMALFRKQMEEGSDLKTREYIARGMIVIGVGRDPDFSEDSPYRLTIPNDDSIDSLAMLLVSLESRGVPSPEEVRNFAEKKLTYSVKLKQIMQGVAS